MKFKERERERLTEISRMRDWWIRRGYRSERLSKWLKEFDCVRHFFILLLRRSFLILYSSTLDLSDNGSESTYGTVVVLLF